MAVSASFMFSSFLYSVIVADITEVRGDSYIKNEKIDSKIDYLNAKTEQILVSQARMETKIDLLTP